ncbi:MAG: hypothetical protein P4L22_01730 [Candidatus Babeliales bacterium]|nr:hypothetical protein [Candidatus Babeliales bacterium]
MKKFILSLSLLILSSNMLGTVQITIDPEVKVEEQKTESIYLKSAKAGAFVLTSYYLGKCLGYFAENTPEIMLLPGALITGLNIYKKVSDNENPCYSKDVNNINFSLVCAACVTCLHLKMDSNINPENHFSRLTTGIESSLLILEMKNYIINLIKNAKNK